MDERLTPQRRLKKRQDFLRLQAEGRKVRSQHLLLSYSTNASFSDSRIGITITKKIDKRSVGRNRLRRRIREIFRRLRGRFERHGEFVVVALTGSAELSRVEVRSELVMLLKRANILPARPGQKTPQESK